MDAQRTVIGIRIAVERSPEMEWIARKMKTEDESS